MKSKVGKLLPTGGHKETYTLLSARRRYMKKLMRQHVSAPWSSTTTSTGGARAQHELFELLERVQCSRLDDQRAVLPPYFSQHTQNAAWVIRISRVTGQPVRSLVRNNRRKQHNYYEAIKKADNRIA
ncbi:unnamed protein product [Arctia plantaginis]|uniref:Uncharacterized protein n=1 Tax=Arctia plantaginis TaxID=874455 RepID=A0A8S1B5J6_ARCPL|nr:unnamed protein product [Arctia plantaginis]CAB3253253.1 unnamed protein product [Arctia plantaginis]